MLNILSKILPQTKAWKQTVTSAIIPTLSDMYNDALIHNSAPFCKWPWFFLPSLLKNRLLMQILFSKGCSIIGLNIYKLCIIIGELLKTQQNSLLPQPEQQSRFHILRWQYGNYLVFSHLPTAGQPRAGRHILALSPRREFTVLFCFFSGDCMYLSAAPKGATHLYFHC